MGEREGKGGGCAAPFSLHPLRLGVANPEHSGKQSLSFNRTSIFFYKLNSFEHQSEKYVKGL